MKKKPAPKTTKLARHLGFGALVIYGIGDVLGAGIYSLAGKVVGLAGPAAWLSFLLAAIVAIITGLSYAELSSRMPVAAGAVAFTRRAFNHPLIGTLVGVLVLSTGFTSAATITVAFSEYFYQLVSLPPPLVQLFFILLFSFLSFWGIRESSRVNMVLTSVEFLGLVAVIIVGLMLMKTGDVSQFLNTSPFTKGIDPIFAGLTIAFFAYMGFEDLCNLADEAKDPGRDIPRAIMIAIGVSTVLYMTVTLVLQITIPQEKILDAEAPLLLIFTHLNLPWIAEVFAIVAMLAIANTGLANLIMASRLLYGMATEGLLPTSIGKVHKSRLTPWVGVLITAAATTLLVYTGGLKILAQTTSLLILIIFFTVHLSLLKIKYEKQKHAGFKIPLIFPLLGCLSCLGLIVTYPLDAYFRTVIVLLLGVGLWLVQKKHKNNAGNVIV